MRNYGIYRPMLAFGEETLRGVARRMRAVWRQRRIQAGRNVRVSSSLECFGEGRIVIGDGVEIRRGVILKSDARATLEIGPGSVIDTGCYLEACAGQVLKLGARFGLGPRAVIRSVAGIEWGDNCCLGADSQVFPRESGGSGRLTVGRGSHFQRDTVLDLCADITIGDHVRSGPFCSCYTHNHIPAVGKLIWEQGLRSSPIRLGDGVWIGQGCIFLPGVEIGANAVVAAGAVVTKAVEAETVVGGVPAKVISRIGSA
jgi:acetyltransferase-like isoleucine patch superfamily enzyme